MVKIGPKGKKAKQISKGLDTTSPVLSSNAFSNPSYMYTGAGSIRFHDRDETGSQSRDGSGPMNESQTPAPYSSQLAIKRTEDTSLKLIYQK